MLTHAKQVALCGPFCAPKHLQTNISLYISIICEISGGLTTSDIKLVALKESFGV